MMMEWNDKNRCDSKSSDLRSNSFYFRGIEIFNDQIELKAKI